MTIPLPFSQPCLSSDSSVTPTGLNAGDVRPNRFIRQTGENLGAECTTANQRAVGVSDSFTDRYPNDITSTTLIAVAGRGIPYKGPGHIVDVLLGDTVTAAGLLATDNAGRAVPATGANTYVLAQALRGGVVNTLVPALLLAPWQLTA